MNKDCVSLEVAQKLQQLGYKQESEYEYIFLPEKKIKHPSTREYYLRKEEWKVLPSKSIKSYPNKKVSAPTATQLAEELPKILEEKVSYKDDLGKYHLEIHSGETWSVRYQYYYYEPCDEFEQESKHLPDALGLMMVYLLENNLLSK
jgi:hypothetical protein